MERLSGVEKLFVAAADAGMGQGFALAVLTEGEIDRRWLDRAWRIFQNRFPIARSRLVRGKLLPDGWVGYAWKPDLDRDFPVRWEELPVASTENWPAYEQAVVERLEAWSNTGIRIREEPPFQLVALRSPGRTSLVFRAHHSGVDGAALVALCMETLEIYNALHRGERPSSEPPRNRGRRVVRYLRLLGPRRLREALAASRAVGKWNRPRRNEPLPLRWTERSCRTGCAQLVFSPVESGALREACKLHSISLNDAFLGAVARAGISLAAERGAPMRKISLAVPVHLRPYLGLDVRETISNQATTVNLPVPASEIPDRTRLLAVVKEFSGAIKRSPLPLLALAEIVLLSLAPSPLLVRVLRKMLAAPTPHSTVPTLTVSNVGAIWKRPDGSTVDRVGDARIVALRNVYQSGYPASGTLSLYTFGGSLNLQMSYPRGGWDQPQAEDFLARIRIAIHQLLGPEPVAGPPPARPLAS